MSGKGLRHQPDLKPASTARDDGGHPDISHWNSLRPSAVAFALVLSEVVMNGIIYLVGLVVVVLAILSFLGLR